MASSCTGFDRRPLCRTCNDLNYKGHQAYGPGRNRLRLFIKFSELDRDCPFCGLVILSVESVVDKDSWNARIMDPTDWKEVDADIGLDLEKDKPALVWLWFWHENPNHTRPDVDNIASGNSGIRESKVRFVIYSNDEVLLPPTAQEFDAEQRLIRYRCAHCCPPFLHFHPFEET